MTKLHTGFVGILSLIPFVVAQALPWGQCGGNGWTGPTTCASGSTCVFFNEWYSQCIPGSSGPTSTVSSTTAAPSSTPIVRQGLHKVATSAGKLFFGSATDNGELSDAPYVAILSDTNEFGQITPGNSMKWDATERSRNTFSFTNGDVIADLADANGQLLRGHTCVWHSQLPSWVSSGGFNNATLLQIVENHCSAVVGHYKGRTYAWDVVNEPFNEDGTFRSSVFYTTTGTAFIAAALRAARAADPDTKLYINDYNLEYSGAKVQAMASLAKSLLDQGVPLDGVGFQGHLIVGSVPGRSTLISNLELFTNLGLEVAYTELDIRMTLPVTDALLAQQKTDYQTVVSSCQAVPGCVGVTIWDYTDKYSWVPSTFPGEGAALPWDENLVAKPAYDGIVAGFA